MRPIEHVVATKAGAWFFVHVATRIDRVLMPLTGGRVKVTLSMPSGLLVCRGAKSGAERRVPLVYVPLEDGRVLLVASNGGAAKHPAWYHNLRAHPDVAFAARDGERPYTARLVTDPAQRKALWGRAQAQYLGYDVYQARAGGREIGVFELTPR